MLAIPPADGRVETSFPGLTLESTLQDLPLHPCQIESNRLGKEAAQIFDQNPLLPGIILMEKGQMVGMISRRRFLEQMSRPYGLELFMKRSLLTLYSFIRTEIMILSGGMLIVVAARQALMRSPALLYEPVVVQVDSQSYCLLDVYQLLVAQSQIHELTRQLLHEKNQAQILQSEKMASLGRMVAGVAHEILNPVNFLCGNLNYFSTYSQALIQLFTAYHSEISDPPDSIVKLQEDLDLEFLIEDLPRVVDSMKVGAERLKTIVGSLRNFSHMSENDRRFTDIHDCLENTLLLLHNRLKHHIEVVKTYGELPPVSCCPGQISQVFMNIIGNAIDALLDKFHQSKEEDLSTLLGQSLPDIGLHFQPSWIPRLEITTDVRSPNPSSSESDRPWAVIRIADNGSGIPEEIQGRIFDTFFTTKPVGEGTGLGLAISRQIIEEKHQGQLNLRSQVNAGTEFEILLPLTPNS